MKITEDTFIDKPLLGMDDDAHPLDQPEGTYRGAINFMINPENGSKNLLHTEDFMGKIAYDFSDISVNDRPYIIHHYQYIGDNEIVLFYGNSNLDSNIAYFKLKDNKFSNYKLIAKDLKFDRNSPIQSTYRVLKEGKKLVYFTDNLNPPRVIDVSRNILSTDNVNTFNLFQKDYTIPNIKDEDVTKLYNFKGVTIETATIGLKSGSYNFTLQYSDGKGNFSKIVLVTDTILIKNEGFTGSNNLNNGFYSFGNTNKSIKLNFENLSSSYYKYVRIGILEANSGTGQVNNVLFTPPFKYENNEFTFTYTGQEIDLIQSTYPELLKYLVDNEIRTAKTITQIDNRLLLGNINNEEIDWKKLQKYATKIKIEPNTSKVWYRTLSSFDKGIETKNVFPNHGEMLMGEAYLFGIVYVFENNLESPAYPLFPDSRETIKSEVYNDYYELDKTYEGDYWGVDHTFTPIKGKKIRIFKANRKNSNIAVNFKNIEKIPDNEIGKKCIGFYIVKERKNKKNSVVKDTGLLCNFIRDVKSNFNSNWFGFYYGEAGTNKGPYKKEIEISSRVDSSNWNIKEFDFAFISDSFSFLNEKVVSTNDKIRIIKMLEKSSEAYLSTYKKVFFIDSVRNFLLRGNNLSLTVRSESGYNSKKDITIKDKDGSVKYMLPGDGDISSDINNNFLNISNNKIIKITTKDLKKYLDLGSTDYYCYVCNIIRNFDEVKNYYNNYYKIPLYKTHFEYFKTDVKKDITVFINDFFSDRHQKTSFCFSQIANKTETKEKLENLFNNVSNKTDYFNLVNLNSENKKIFTENLKEDFKEINLLRSIRNTSTFNQETLLEKKYLLLLKKFFDTFDFLDKSFYDNINIDSKISSDDKDVFLWIFQNLRFYHTSHLNTFFRLQHSLFETPNFADSEKYPSYIYDKNTLLSYLFLTDRSSGNLTYQGYASSDFQKLNLDYERREEQMPFYCLQEDFDPSDTIFKHRVYYSEQNFEEITADNYRNFLPNNYRDIQSNTGEITNFFTIKDNLYIHTEESLYHLPRNLQERVTGDVVSFLGTGEYFNIPPRPVLDEDIGLSPGCRFPQSFVKTDKGVFFVSDNLKKIYNFTGEVLTEISNKGLSNFFKNRIGSSVRRDFDFYNYKFITSYDYKNQRLFFIKIQGVSSWVVSFSLHTNSWISFHYSKTHKFNNELSHSLYTKDSILFFSDTDKKFYKNSYFLEDDLNRPNESKINIILKKQNLENKVWNFIRIFCESEEELTGADSGEKSIKKTSGFFNYIYFYNSHQVSKNNEIYYTSKDNITLYPQEDEVLAKKIRSFWAINKILDVSNTDVVTPFIDQPTTYYIDVFKNLSNQSNNPLTYKSKKFNDNYLGIVLTYNHVKNKRLILKYILGESQDSKT